MSRPDLTHTTGITYDQAGPAAVSDSAVEGFLSHAASRFLRTTTGQPDLVWIRAEDRDILDR